MSATPHDSNAHRWAIDGLEDRVARIEEDGETILTIPRWLLPVDAVEGQLLSVTRTSTQGASTITITLDATATAAAMKKSAKSVENIAKISKNRDGGGNVIL
jgi:hypothetical protein